MIYNSCLEKQKQIKELFSSCDNAEEKYKKIIEIGKSLPSLHISECIEKNLVKGCQSTVYLVATKKEDKISFQIQSDALISAGLAALLLAVYNNEPPETILKCPPDFLKDLNIDTSLTPSRANGLYSIHLRMKQEALKLLLEKSST